MIDLFYVALILATIDAILSYYGIRYKNLRESGFIGKRYGQFIRFLVILALIFSVYYLRSTTGLAFFVGILFLACSWNVAVITRKRRT